MKSGQLRLRSIALSTPAVPSTEKTEAGGRTLHNSKLSQLKGRTVLTLPADFTLRASETLSVVLG